MQGNRIKIHAYKNDKHIEKITQIPMKQNEEKNDSMLTQKKSDSMQRYTLIHTETSYN